MSSLSATQSDGYYLPPEYFESGAYKKVSRNAYAAKTEASARSSKNSVNRNPTPKVGHNQWLKHGVVRFELPEKAVCLGCKKSVGRGTRFNARKIKTDQSYFTTPIFEFRLSCRNCKEYVCLCSCTCLNFLACCLLLCLALPRDSLGKKRKTGDRSILLLHKKERGREPLRFILHEFVVALFPEGDQLTDCSSCFSLVVLPPPLFGALLCRVHHSVSFCFAFLSLSSGRG